jgi:ubiquinone/menaquinone biosynthesis C-methylase UbiE
MKTKQNGEYIKHFVRNRYAKLVTTQGKTNHDTDGEGDCCIQIQECSQQKIPINIFSTNEDFQQVPTWLKEWSFGCGKPLDYAILHSGNVVVDLGAGTGLDAIMAAQKVAPNGRVIAVDMTPAMLNRARENARMVGVFNIEFVLSDVEVLPLDDEIADLIISNCVINLCPDKNLVFQEAFRVLKKGGKLIVSDIVVEGLSPEILQGLDVWASCIGGAISETEYLRKIIRVGFKDVQILDRVIYSSSFLKSSKCRYKLVLDESQYAENPLTVIVVNAIKL